MLNDLSIGVETENVDARPRPIARPILIAVENYVIAFSDYTLDLHFFARILSSHTDEVVNECLLSVADARIVLDILVTDITLDCISRARLVEHEFVKSLGVSLVALESLVHLRSIPSVGGRLTPELRCKHATTMAT
jgi:hypothetical protein